MGRGVVQMVNKRIGRVAIDAGNGNYTVADITDVEGFELGDRVRGDLSTHGDGIIVRERDNCEISVYVEVVQATLASAEIHTFP